MSGKNTFPTTLLAGNFTIKHNHMTLKTKPPKLLDKIFDNEEMMRQAATDEISMALEDFKDKIKKISKKIKNDK